jgi:hypothetical protein
MAHAPSSRALEIGAPVDLGTWDDTYLLPEPGLLLVRRGKQWFRLSVGADARPAPWFEQPEPQQARIEGHIDTGGMLWLIFGQGSYAPFALEPTRGKRLDFQVPDTGCRLQSFVAVPHLGAMLAMVESVDQTKWPRPENRPLYFWASLTNENVKAMPVGWDLDWLTGDRTVAVFQGPLKTGRPFRPPDFFTLDLATGELRDERVYQSRSSYVPFDWCNRDLVVPVHAPWRRDGTRERLAGVFDGRRVVPLALDVADPTRARATIFRDWVALPIERVDGPERADRPLWFAPLRDDAAAVELARNVSSHALLGAGRCAFVVESMTRGHAQAFVYDAGRSAAWNLREDIESLPALDDKLRADRLIHDSLGITLFPGIGPVPGSRPVLAWCSQYRSDIDQLRWPRLVPDQAWQCLVLVTADGRRGVAEAPAAWPHPVELRDSVLFSTGWFVHRRAVEQAQQLTAFLLRLTN